MTASGGCIQGDRGISQKRGHSCLSDESPKATSEPAQVSIALATACVHHRETAGGNDD